MADMKAFFNVSFSGPLHDRFWTSASVASTQHFIFLANKIHFEHKAAPKVEH